MILDPLLLALVVLLQAPSHPDRLGQVVDDLDPRVWAVHQDRGGDHWFGSNGAGVFRYDGERLLRYTTEDGLAGLQVRGFAEDSKGHLLISTTGGVSRFDGDGFETLVVEALPAGEGWRLDPDDVWLVVAPGEGGPCRYDGEKLYRLQLTKSPAEDAFRAKYPDASFRPDGVYSLHEDRRGHLWFGTSSVGLCRYDGKELSWMYEEHLTTTPSGGAFGIRSIFEDRAGDFWICNTRDRFEVARAAKQEGGYRLVDYERKEGLPDARTNDGANFTYYPSMTQDRTADAAGPLWMACGTDGVWSYDGESVTRHPVGDGAYVFGVYRDRDGAIWASTLEEGVHLFDGAEFERF